MLKLIHRWVGTALCGIVLIISLTGTLLIWKAEYLWLSLPGASDKLDRDIETVAFAAEKIQASYGAGEVRFIQLYSEGLALHKVFLSKQRYAWHNQYGERLQVWQGNERWEDWLLDLHHRFLLGNAIGLNIAGVSGLLLMPLALIGLYLWWPWRRFFRFGIRLRSNDRNAWVANHSNLGVLSLLPIFLFAFTGVVLVYPTESRVLLVHGLSDPVPPIESVEASKLELSWLPAFEYVQRRYPGSTLRWLSPPNVQQANLPESVLKVGLQQAGEWNSGGYTSVRFKHSSIAVRDGLEQPRLKRSIDFTYPLHTGKLGVGYRLMLTLFGLMIVGVSAFALGAAIKRHKAV